MTPPKISKQLGRSHKTIARYAQQMVALVRRWLPAAQLTLVGDSSYSVVELGLVCRKYDIALIAPLRLDANLHQEPPQRKSGQRGRGRKIGQALPKLSTRLKHARTLWHSVTLEWYSGQLQQLELITGTALWYRRGLTPLPMRWVVVKGLDEKHPARAFFSTERQLSASQLIELFVGRWSLEVTFEESRAHLGVETQRQSRYLAIERSTPDLLVHFQRIYCAIIRLTLA